MFIFPSDMMGPQFRTVSTWWSGLGRAPCKSSLYNRRKKRSKYMPHQGHQECARRARR